ncbi:Phage-related baseplate assembly protein [Pseudorhizobium banfieldiae]|uniref:Phage-related baseplate assembly protein n=1 Tax=Pseudorhizobium banfieldiae TaxID=1125847 RepID=L0NE77_9HYPH|nr:hypothetical protein [Pseudorhizobium banfieldiae]CAD6606236.1 baseplate assembly protein [arsenite-oxidising bacterium NT-25]CCF19164.1 Phage-related baseplate assembly protein [Pseudorhizobium banfieldiae]
MTRVGLDKQTGRPLLGWAHCVQSISTIISTELNERVQRRGFGGRLMRLIDRPQNEETIIDIYVSVAEALEPRKVEGREYGEPGFVLLRTSLDAGTPGRLLLLVSGVFFENGHLGDYSNPKLTEVAFAITENDGQIALAPT